MGEEEGWSWPPAEAPPLYVQTDDHWRHLDSINAVSLGFVATAILIGMFLVMAIFERLLRPTSPTALSPAGGRNHGDIESQLRFTAKLSYPSPKITVNAREVSVLMPGDDIPTFIAHPAPVPCTPEGIRWPPHHHNSLHKFPLNSTPSTL